MFVGTYPVSLDGTRIALPKEVFDTLGDKKLTFFSIEETKHVFFHSKASLEELRKTMALFPNQLPKSIARMLAHAHVVQIDKKRRLVLPQQIIEQAEIKTACYLIGQGNTCLLQSRPYA
jgi:DNA-binding transcriptional regulator/RsmH inhibitor MraZ